MTDLLLPSLGPDMVSGKLLEWRVTPGQELRKGDVVAVVDTDKAAIDVETWEDGRVESLLVAPGDVVAVGTPIARLSGTAAAQLDSAPRARPRVSPAARVRARALGIDIERLPAPAAGAAISLADVEAHATSAASGDNRAQSLRHAIATTMARAKRDIPHYYLWDEIDVSTLRQWLDAKNLERPITDRLLPAAVQLCAVARAAREFPDMNGTFDVAGYHPSEQVHLGVAIALRGGGLVAPAIMDAASLSLDMVMQQLSDLVRRARSGGLRSSEIANQTITVTNLGDEGSRTLLGVIYPPQVALVGMGRIELRPRVIDGTVVARECLTISLSADHRVSDGRRGARFLERIGQLLQHPEAL